MKIFNVTITDAVNEVLEKGRIEGNIYDLPQVSLDRDKYVQVNKILELLGGKWNRSKKGHVFEDYERASWVMKSLEEGSVLDKKKTYQFFETPKEVAMRMVELSDIKDEMTVLEPSAGHGAIADEIPKSWDIGLVLCEIDKEKCDVLEKKGYGSLVVNEDFLGKFSEQYGTFSRILMNPPFTAGQDIQHVTHAYERCLEEGGRLVSVMPVGFTFKNDKKSVAFRKLVEEKGFYEELTEGSFKESGTNVKTVLVVLNK
jgi:type I restriction-modification system DNA methylase subunit